jgi:hypothetical protein
MEPNTIPWELPAIRQSPQESAAHTDELIIESAIPTTRRKSSSNTREISTEKRWKIIRNLLESDAQSDCSGPTGLPHAITATPPGIPPRRNLIPPECRKSNKNTQKINQGAWHLNG